jgi:hypothetical protein
LTHPLCHDRGHENEQKTPNQQNGRIPADRPTIAALGSSAGQGGGLPVFSRGIALDFDDAGEFICVLAQVNSPCTFSAEADSQRHPLQLLNPAMHHPETTGDGKPQ